MNLALFLEQFFQMTRFPIACFGGKKLLTQGGSGTRQFALPQSLMDSLPDQLPPLWYASTPEHLYFGGVMLKDIQNFKDDAPIDFTGVENAPEVSGAARTENASVAEPLILFLGPVLYQPCTHAQAQRILARLGQPDADPLPLEKELNSFQICTVPQLLAGLKLLSHIFNGKKERPNTLHAAPGGGLPRKQTPGAHRATKQLPDTHQAAEQLPDTHQAAEQSPDTLWSAEPVFLDFCWNQPLPSSATLSSDSESSEAVAAIENNIMSCIRHGKPEALKRYFNEQFFAAPSPPKTPSAAEVSRSRNYILGANLLASRAAASAGLDPQFVNDLSDFYISKLVTAQNSHDLGMVFFELMTDYAAQVARLNAFQTDSPLARKANSYIQAHLYAKISTDSIARSLQVNPTYLSNQFRTAAGKTLTSYIQEQKIHEAKYLMDCKIYSLAEISEMLCFSSQSYFGAVFKKVTGMTPLAWQEREML